MQRADVVRFLFGDVERGGASSRVSPRGPPDPAAFTLLIGASVASLPAIYLLLARDAPAYLALIAGSLSMGLAWAGGCALEGRRRRTVLGLAAAGALFAALAFALPDVPRATAVRLPLAMMGALAALGLASVARRKSAPGKA